MARSRAAHEAPYAPQGTLVPRRRVSVRRCRAVADPPAPAGPPGSIHPRGEARGLGGKHTSSTYTKSAVETMYATASALSGPLAPGGFRIVPGRYLGLAALWSF